MNTPKKPTPQQLEAMKVGLLRDAANWPHGRLVPAHPDQEFAAKRAQEAAYVPWEDR